MRTLIIAGFIALQPACGTLLGAQAEGAGATLGVCVAACAANCVSELFHPGSAGDAAKRYGWCLAPCSAECLPTAARAFVQLPNPPPRCVPGPSELKPAPTEKPNGRTRDAGPSSGPSSRLGPDARTTTATPGADQ